MKTTTAKLEPEQRMSVIVSAAVDVANKDGLPEVTFETVAKRCVMPTTPRTIAHYFKIGDLRRSVVADSRATQEVRDDAAAMGIRV